MTYKVLIVDDNKDIHLDIKKIISPPASSDIDILRSKLFQEVQLPNLLPEMEFLSAYQGEEAVDLIKKETKEGSQIALGFVDIRMPPGFDGVQTIKKLWEIDSDLQIIICTAYSDYSFHNILKELKHASEFLVLKKPFDPFEIKQATLSLLEKWTLKRTKKA